MRVRVLVSGGGTAGHVYPALTVAEHLRDEEHSEVAFVGMPDSLEARLASEAGIEFVGVPARGCDRSRPMTFVTAALTAAWSVPALPAAASSQAHGRRRRLRRATCRCRSGSLRPSPGCPLVLHEQNSVPGLANRLLSRWATTVCVTYAQSILRLARPGGRS